MKRVANLRDRFCLRGKVAITRASHETVTATDSKNDFSKIWRKRDYAIDYGGNADTSPGIVSDFPSRTIVSSPSGSARRIQRKADNDHYTENR
jgi:hypothetical protein